MMGIAIVRPIGKSMTRWRKHSWPTIDQSELAPKALSAMALSLRTPRINAADRASADRETCH